MGFSNYQREDQKFDIIPEGKYRIRIKSAEKTVSKSGNDMLALQFAVSGQTRTLYHYIVDNEWANKNLTQFFDSFKGIADGDFDTSHWIGQVGACVIKHDEYKDTVSEKVKYFISADKQDELPPWQENVKTPDGSVKMTEVTDDDDLPW